jgi:hypothetical protein
VGGYAFVFVALVVYFVLVARPDRCVGLDRIWMGTGIAFTDGFVPHRQPEWLKRGRRLGLGERCRGSSAALRSAQNDEHFAGAP